ncbi:signal peptidase I [Desulfosporosinus orientis DSM 765]|uniref:Signal peptidase I n=1 Tax=Desulfosporosinus orientis (strain ATCC 19365 / DSM 765 / NCIMB 8382 / VKM B-1628 / Singapore I) TaxID=768706 RepID=G7W910_DESOD|nr:signal peptidase I [Desulfosporosinus orientis]AET68219.1 signal peptidase I [Desulfosporosinus orientis DSM 765]
MAKRQGSSKKKLFELLEILFFAFILSWGLRSTIIEAATIPTPSMSPTIQVNDRVLVDKMYYKFSGISRGDIIVFNPPENVNNPKGDPWIKRVIGLPGDTVQIKDGKVFVNDEALAEPYEKAKPNYSYGPLIVPQNSYFVLGDNRNDSYDSHYWGVLPAKNTIGKAMLKYWPLNDFGQLAK